MSPPETLRASLAADRAAGEPFGEAWRRATAAALRTAEQPGEWIAALEGTRTVWRAAYYGSAAKRPELALVLIDSDPERTVSLGEGDRVCDGCGGMIPPGTKRQAIYCSRRCQRRVHDRLVA